MLEATGTACQGVCPACGTPSASVHDRYIRRPRDLPWRGRAVRLRLLVRRFRCENPAWGRRTFAESFAPVLRRYAHFTAEAEALLLQFGHGAGGTVGERLLAGAGLRGSATTVLRRVRRSARPTIHAPAVLGLDEFALTRRRFATVLVDLQLRGSALGYLSPVEYERRYAAAALTAA